jgi:hypothetical protein
MPDERPATHGAAAFWHYARAMQALIAEADEAHAAIERALTAKLNDVHAAYAEISRAMSRGGFADHPVGSSLPGDTNTEEDGNGNTQG